MRLYSIKKSMMIQKTLKSYYHNPLTGNNGYLGQQHVGTCVYMYMYMYIVCCYWYIFTVILYF